MHERYARVDHAWITSHCFFCESELKMDGCGMPVEEVGEFWSDALEDSVLGHPDCTPLGIDAIQTGEDPDWKMA
jgi:hypothetical protein